MLESWTKNDAAKGYVAKKLVTKVGDARTVKKLLDVISEKNANYFDQWGPPKAYFDIFECNPISYDKILWTKTLNGHFADFKGDK